RARSEGGQLDVRRLRPQPRQPLRGVGSDRGWWLRCRGGSAGGEDDPRAHSRRFDRLLRGAGGRGHRRRGGGRRHEPLREGRCRLMSSTYNPSRSPGAGRRSPVAPGGRRTGPGRSGGGRRPLTNFRIDPASPFRHVDLVLLVTTFVLIAFSALMVYSATRGPAPPYRNGDGIRVLIFGTVGAAAMVGVALLDHRRLKDWWPFVYGASVVL